VVDFLKLYSNIKNISNPLPHFQHSNISTALTVVVALHLSLQHSLVPASPSQALLQYLPNIQELVSKEEQKVGLVSGNTQYLAYGKGSAR
jgi:hypothetical protein